MYAKCVRGTSNDYRHGHDTPITRQNIALEQLSRENAGLEPADVDTIVKEFVHFPETRHFFRAMQLMPVKTWQSPVCTA